MTVEATEVVSDLTSLQVTDATALGDDRVKVGPDRLAQLRGQLDARLKPVLRAADFDAFDLDRAFRMIAELASRLSDRRRQRTGSLRCPKIA